MPLRARAINDDMSAWALARLGDELGGLSGKRVLILGLAYRENVKELAFSGATRLVAELKEAGATPLLNDPLYSDAEITRFGATPVSLDGLPQGDAVILQAYHDQYRSLEWNALPALGYKVVLDGRNSLDRAVIEAAGLRYLGIGR